MKKLLYLLFAFPFVALASACSSDEVIEDPQDEPQDDNPTEEVQEVYFSSSNPDSLALSEEQTYFEIALGRTLSTDALSVPIEVSGNDDNLYTVPSVAEFVAGQSTTSLRVLYDPELIGYNKFSVLTFTITSYAAASGLSSYTVKVGIPREEDPEWESLGTGKFSDNFIMENSVYEIEIQRSTTDTNRFRLVNPYEHVYEGRTYTKNAGPSEYVVFELAPPGYEFPDSPGNITVTKDDLIYFYPYYVGVYYTYTNAAIGVSGSFEVMAQHASASYTINNSVVTEDDCTYSCVKSWQEDNGLPAVVQFAPFYLLDGMQEQYGFGGGWYYIKSDDIVIITFPGVD